MINLKSILLNEVTKVNPKILQYKTQIQSNIGKKVEKRLNKDLMKLTTNAEDKVLDFMVRQLFPIDDLITQATDLIPIYTELITFHYFECIQYLPNSEKSVNHFLDNIFTMVEMEINKMGYVSKKIIISQLKKNDMKIDDFKLELPPRKMKELLRYLNNAFFIGPYIDYITEVRNLDVGGTGCDVQRVPASASGRTIVRNKLNELLPKINQSIIKKLKS